MLKQVLNITGGLSQKQIQDNPDYEHYDYISLGYVCKGINNSQGHSKLTIELGKDPIKLKQNHTVLKMTHKYYHLHSQTPHHTDVEYYQWSGNLYDYIKKYIKKGKQNE